MPFKTIIHYRLLFLMPALLLLAATAPIKIIKAGVKINEKGDTTKSFRLKGRWVKPKDSFMFNAPAKTNGDTLSLVTCANYVYSPFGDLTNKNSLKSSLLRNFNIKNRIDKMDVGPEEFQILQLKSSRMVLFFDPDPQASPHSYILKGEIYNSEVTFAKGIRIGMDMSNFYDAFFDHFPKQLSYKVVVLISCVDNIKQVYTFKNNKLQSVIFLNDTYWKIHY